MDTDRNLLFAVLALQFDYIDRDGFVNACAAWAVRKDAPIADAFVALRLMTPDDCAQVEQLMQRRLKKHGGDVQASLAAAAGAGARAALASVADADVERSLVAISGLGVSPTPTDPESTVPPPDSAGRNFLYEEIGRGGMGRVLRGRDPALGRDLAVKVLHEAYRDRPDVESRFVEEAQIGGQLQHPGVVPVYELGRFPDRRPFFTMKLVKGHTLAQLLSERPDPAHDVPRFLNIFEQVCQTVAYAHSKGVMHRDLKPSNVMVGAFGEVQVMDWGLAKVLAREKRAAAAAPAAPPIVTTRSGSTAEDGRTGVIGTPAFMPPEQARGEAEAVDERADVFGLGGILCAILTGQPPYVSADAEGVLRMAAKGEVAEAFARLDRCGADAELVALCKACLAPVREGRPREAGEVAARMAAHAAAVQERLRAAELERAAAEARAAEAKATAAAERRARRRTRALAAVAVALVAVGVGSGLWMRQQAKDRRQAVVSDLDKAKESRDQMRFRQAADMLGRARTLLGEGGPGDLRQRMEKAEKELALINRLDSIRQRLTTVIEGKSDTRAAERDYAAAFREAGLGEVGDDPELVAERIRASDISVPLVAALDDWTHVGSDADTRSWLLRVARQAAPDPWGDRFRDPAVWEDRHALRALADDAVRDGGANLVELSPQLLGALGARLGGGADAVGLLLLARQRYLDDFWLNMRLGNALIDAKRPEEAVGFFRVAVALRPDAAGAHVNLGFALRGNKNLDEAIAEYSAAIHLAPGFALAHNNLGKSLSDKKELDGAIAEFREAIDLDSNLAIAQYNLGEALSKRGDRDGAIAAFRKAIDLDPDDADAHTNLGAILNDDLKNHDGAIAEFRTAIRIDPNHALAHFNLGNALHAISDLDGAIAAYRQAIAIDPQLASAHNNLGSVLREKQDIDGAIVEFRKAVDLDPKLAVAHYNLGNTLYAKPDVDGAIAAYRNAITFNPKHAQAHFELGNALYDKGNLDGAIVAYRQAIEIDPKQAHAHNPLGAALGTKGDLDGAITEFRLAIAHDPNDAGAHNNLGNILYYKKDLEGAIAEFRKAIDLDPMHANAYIGLSTALLGQGRFAEAETAARRCLELLPERDARRQPVFRKLQECERLAAADENLPAILSGQAEPANAAERLALGQLCQQYKHQHTAAARFYADAFAADPKLAESIGPGQQHRYNAACSAALAAAGQGEDAGNLPDKVRLMLRRQALGWLRADLAPYAKLAERKESASTQTVRERLGHWQQDTDLASVRDGPALAALPDDERRQWRQFWDDVAALLKQVEPKK
jgi:serine/threonine-protein kinase